MNVIDFEQFHILIRDGSYCAIKGILDILMCNPTKSPKWEVDELSYRIYQKDIRNIKRLEYQEEQALIKLKCEGNCEAYNRLLLNNLGYVMYIARQYQNNGLPLNDLVGEGNFGLIEAIKKVEPRGFSVRTYASYYIRSSIQQAILRYGKQVYINQAKSNQYSKIKKYINEYMMIYGQTPSIDDIAEYTQIDYDKIQDILYDHSEEISIDYFAINYTEPYPDDVNDSLFLNCESIIFNLENQIMQRESLYRDLIQIMKKLSDRERCVLMMFFGIRTREKSLEKIAAKLNLTRERVRQIKDRAIKKLKGNKDISLLKQYLG